MVSASADLIAGALDLHVLRGVSFHDALIVQAALVSGCHRVLSEDLQDGVNLGGVRIENPFAGV
jgi:predicted nucleic acid-binding protein